MDYKSVIEEQIRELQKVQDKISGLQGHERDSCEVARTIIDLVREAKDN